MKKYKIDRTVVYNGDCFKTIQLMDKNSVDCIVTSPPYWGLRDYDEADQFGLEQTAEEYIEKMVSLFREIKNVLKDTGTVWLNLGDSYTGGAGSGKHGKTAIVGNTLSGCQKTIKKDGKPKDLVGIPWRVALALKEDGWYLRQDIIWNKPNAMPESVTDRCTKAHEYIFLLSKSKNYYFDNEAIKEPVLYDGRKDTVSKGSKKYKNSILPNDKEHKFASAKHERWQWKNGVPMKNKRSVWTVTTKPFKGSHFAVFPKKLIEPCILAGCPENGTVLDPFGGSGTTAVVANNLNRNAILCELNPKYIEIIKQRIKTEIKIKIEHAKLYDELFL